MELDVPAIMKAVIETGTELEAGSDTEPECKNQNRGLPALISPFFFTDWISLALSLFFRDGGQL